MEVYALFVDILKLTVAGIGVVYIAFYLFKPYLDKSQNLQLLDFKKTISTQTLPLRLQAYERLVLFTERINPANMLLRLNSTGYSAAELHTLILQEVRNEYQHNVTQQIYVSGQAWALLKRVKEDTINMVNSAYRTLPESAGGLDLSRVVLNHLAKLEDNPYDIAINLIRKDVGELF